MPHVFKSGILEFLDGRFGLVVESKGQFLVLPLGGPHGPSGSPQLPCRLLSRFLVSTFSTLGYQTTAAYINFGSNAILYSHRATLGFVP